MYVIPRLSSWTLDKTYKDSKLLIPVYVGVHCSTVVEPDLKQVF